MKYDEMTQTERKKLLSPRTDLAVEMQEELREQTPMEGIRVQTKVNRQKGMKETIIIVENDHGSRLLGKPKGTYITIEGDDRFADPGH